MKNERMVVYLLWCETSEKGYVGQSTGPLTDRLSSHRSNARKGKGGRLYDEIRELGFDAFEVFVLERCSTVEELNAYEVLWITEMSTTDTALGYNDRAGGNNRTHSEETKQRCRVAGRLGAPYGFKGAPPTQ